MRTIAIVNQKGGCGKTTTAINLAALYAKRGLRTLLVDMDPQSHCAVGLGVPEARIEYSIGDALIADHSRGFDSSRLVWEVARNLYLAPSTMLLSALESPGGGLHQLPDKDRRLESLLQVMSHQYDRCLIDCPPTIGLLTFNALRASREALIPVETGFFSLRGAEKQWSTIQRMIAHIDRPIACHLLATLHNPDSRLAGNILAALKRQFAGQIVPVVIREHEVLREAASFGQPVIEFAPDSEAQADFDALADWLEEHAVAPVQIEITAGQAHGVAAMTAPATRPQSFAAFSDGSSAAVMVGAATSPMGVAGVPVSRNGANRAAELARRMHELSNRQSHKATAQHSAVMSIDPESVRSIAEEIQTGESQPGEPLAAAVMTAVSRLPLRSIESMQDSLIRENPSQSLTHIYGARSTSRGVLFVQPAEGVRSICVAGDFNGWSPSTTPLRFNPALNIFEAMVPLSRGRHHYRLVIDGRWLSDSHNPNTQSNAYGEPNSVVEVGG